MRNTQECRLGKVGSEDDGDYRLPLTYVSVSDMS